jgi:ribosomal protein S18 acetylase RimI-like enzyme
MIRPATDTDIPAMVSLLRQLFAIEEDFVFDAARQQRGLELLLDGATALVLVAEENGAVVGMATAQLLISTAEGAPSLIIEDVVVTPARQHRGIGSELLERLAEWGAGRGASRMQLLADRTNDRALDFYRQKDWLQTQLICLRKYN